MAKTNLDLQLSATRAAQASLAITGDYQLENAMLESFNADGNDGADFSAWRKMFAETRQHFQLLASQPAPSVLEAKEAATIAARAATADATTVAAGGATGKAT